MQTGGLPLLLELLALGARLAPASARTRPDFCLLPPEPGRCEAYIPRYYYQPATKRCKQFIYGGCNGNRNNFTTLRKCQDTCAAGAKTGGPP
ncbi:kunitz-type serine protease inhibitor-like [Varanus komodoensis]|uniref:kunitz-type serine protease inhibitor-like n=1 Tax=Varanus komodoensis TaxID=61221 RepID=UPI001CF7BF1D|nr:kunitz-type serine protease inhibitor-like [Varanus komodoensis]